MLKGSNVNIKGFKLLKVKIYNAIRTVREKKVILVKSATELFWAE